MGLKNVFKSLLGVNRELTNDQFFTQIYEALETSSGFDYPYLLEYMRSEQGDYIVVTDNGKLYRLGVDYANDSVTLSEPTEVAIEYVEVPAERSRTFVRRNADGQLYFYGIAAAAVLNRVAELDTTALFDSFEEAYEDQEDKAYLTFYHLGEAVRFGTVEKVFRYEKFLIISGLVDETTTIGSRIAEKLGDNSDGVWGISIGFRITEEPEVIRIGNTEISTFNRGILIECSLLKENAAASYFTTISSLRSGNMGYDRDRAKKALLEFLGTEAEDEVESLLDDANVRSRKIEDEKMITRDGDPEPEPEVVVEEPVVEEEAPEEVELEITEEIIDAIAIKVAEKITVPVFDSSELVAELETARARIDELTERLASVEREDNEKIQEATLSLSTAVRNRNVKVVYKQFTEPEAETKDEEEMSPRERARANREKIKVTKG
jgi:hypothetical protein